MPRHSFPALALACLLSSAPAPAAEPSADPYAALAKFEFGQSRQPLAQIEAQIRQTAPADYKAIESKLLAVLQSPQTSQDAKRFICRWLTTVGSAECIPAVADLLTDPDLSHPARLALEPKADPAAGAALRAALPKVQGPLLAGLIGSIGVRRDAQAIGELRRLVLQVRLANDKDPVVAGAALAALGAIGTVESAQALDDAAGQPALSRSLARAKLAAASHLAVEAQGPAAAKIYGALMSADQPPAVRVAALKGLVGTLPRAEAAQRIVELVQGDDAALRTATVAAYASAADKALKDAVAAQLPAMKPAGQRLLLGVLADQADVVVRPAVLQVLEGGGQEDVRVAALECLAQHGEAGDVPLVVKLANGPPQAVADAARKVLQRMGKPGVDEVLTKLIESPQPADRAIVLAALANRRVESALPTLQRLVAGADPALAAEAAKALNLLGKSEQLPSLAGVLIRNPNAEVRGAVEEAVRAICQRAPDKLAAAQALLAAWPQATTPQARSSLLPLLAATRGEPALGAVCQALRDENEEVREAGVRTLIAWPEASAVPHLIDLAKTTQKPTHAVLALRDGCLRLANSKELPLAQRLSIYRSVLAVAKRPEEKKQAIAGLAELPVLGALEMLQGCLPDEALRSDATSATIRLARQLGVVYNQRALAALRALESPTASDAVRQEVADAIRTLQNAGQSPEGFVVAWMVSGPYLEAGKTCGELFDLAFAPEQSGVTAEWRPVAVSPGGRSGLVELDKIFGGQDRAAYLRTALTATKAQDVLLELGSDDGLKVWLNGQVVHANNATRPCTPGQDKVKVLLKQGVNTLLLKITQGGGEWSACCRLRAADGQPLDGVTIAPNEP